MPTCDFKCAYEGELLRNVDVIIVIILGPGSLGSGLHRCSYYVSHPQLIPQQR